MKYSLVFSPIRSRGGPDAGDSRARYESADLPHGEPQCGVAIRMALGKPQQHAPVSGTLVQQLSDLHSASIVPRLLQIDLPLVRPRQGVGIRDVDVASSFGQRIKVRLGAFCISSSV